MKIRITNKIQLYHKNEFAWLWQFHFLWWIQQICQIWQVWQSTLGKHRVWGRLQVLRKLILEIIMEIMMLCQLLFSTFQLRIKGHFSFRTFGTKFCNILKYGMNLKFETIVQFFRKIMQLNAVIILKSTNEYYRKIISKSVPKMDLYPAMTPFLSDVPTVLGLLFRLQLPSYVWTCRLFFTLISTWWQPLVTSM